MRRSLVTDENACRWTLALAGAVAFAVISPSFHFGQISGHDFEFHLAAWMDVARQWRQGVLFPRWAAWANFGYGEPRFILYPPVSWLLGAALGCVLPWWMVPDTFLVLVIVLSGWSMYRLARDWMPPGAAVASALLFAANPYQLLVVYFRSDFAELLASSVFPLAVHYALRCGCADAPIPGRPHNGTNLRNLTGLALSYGVIWLCNAPAAVIASYALALLLLAQTISWRSLRPLLVGAAAMAIGLLLAAFYIVPAAYEQKWVNIAQVLSNGLLPEQNFLFTNILDPEHNLFNLLASTIGLVSIGLAAVSVTLAFRRAPEHRCPWALFVLTAVAICFMTPLSIPFWRYAPKLRFVQFPWRWLFVLGFCAAFFLGQVVARSRKPIFTQVCLLLILLLSAVTMVSGVIAPPWWDSESVGTIAAQVQTERGYEGADEYCVRGADCADLNVSSPPVLLSHETGKVSLGDWRPEEKEFVVDTPVRQVAAVHLLAYPAWQVRINGRQVAAQTVPGTGQMLLTVPEGKSQVTLRFGETSDRIVGDAFTGIGVCLLVGLNARYGTRRAKRTGT